MLVVFSFLITLIYLFPLYFFGEKAYVQIFDNLDIVIPILKVLTHSGMMFSPSDAIIPNVMGGLPRLVYGSELNVYVWLHYYFSPFVAFTINETLIHVGAYLSMVVLLNRYFVPPKHYYRVLIIHSVSLMFAILPFYTGAGLSVPTLPLALYAFLNIRNRKSTWREWLILIVIPFYSNLVLIYFFFLLTMSGFWIFDWVRTRKINIPFLLALVVMSLSYIVVEYRMFYDMFIGHLFVSHRTEFFALQNHTLWETYKTAHRALLLGSVDMDTHASAVLLPFMLFSMIMTLVTKRLSSLLSLLSISLFSVVLFNPNIIQLITGNKFAMPALLIISLILWGTKKQYRLFYTFILLQIFFAYWYALWFYEGTAVLAQHIPILKEFNFARILLLQPLWWAIITVYGMVIISKKLRFSPLIIVGIVLVQSYLALNIREFSAPKKSLSFQSYYGEKLFSDIKAYLGKDFSHSRVGCLGFDPAIAIYNGLYTVDGYFPNYPLEYKHKFQKIIEKPLNKNSGNKTLFYGWGSKCYLLDGDEPYLLIRKNVTLKNININFNAFYELGGRYLISAHEIEKPQMNNLILEKIFEDKDTFWTMYLYRVEPDKITVNSKGVE